MNACPPIGVFPTKAKGGGGNGKGALRRLDKEDDMAAKRGRGGKRGPKPAQLKWRRSPKPPFLEEKRALRLAHERFENAIKRIHADLQNMRDRITASDC